MISLELRVRLPFCRLRRFQEQPNVNAYFISPLFESPALFSNAVLQRCERSDLQG